jgi:N-acetylmuramoyl-L-alanine amidase CwlA
MQQQNDFVEAINFDVEMYLAGMMACKHGEPHQDGKGYNFDKGFSDQHTIEQMLGAGESN